ncbi:MAG: hypothetical protein CM1200mP9_04800 [Gammaproteobacteria bacterium]|nr:MAG: hypothetical protein CM1200mP9_04800 [Gammaproteobacteria bacterium]
MQYVQVEQRAGGTSSDCGRLAKGTNRRRITVVCRRRLYVPVPTPKPQLLARDAFLYLVMFTALYVSGFNLGPCYSNSLTWHLLIVLGQKS